MSTRSALARVLLWSATIVAACGAPTAPPATLPGAASPATLPLETCTIDTPLTSGVPGSPGNLIATELQPEGASELAVMMRTMQADLGAAREALAAGRPVPPMTPHHRKMRCSWPTTPSDRNPVFDGFAQAYLAQLAALESAPPAEAREAYTAVVDACKSCHQQSCPGPIAAIEKLRLPVE